MSDKAYVESCPTTPVVGGTLLHEKLFPEILSLNTIGGFPQTATAASDTFVALVF